MTAMRRGVMEHMRRSVDTAAHVTSAIEVDFARVVALRSKLKPELAAQKVNLTYLAFIARASVDTILDYPYINGELRGQSIVTRPWVNLGIAVSLGEEGLIVVKGANVMAGYLGKPEKTKEVVRDGWYATGDMGRQDEDGFTTITGRLSRFAKIGGEMVPLERLDEEMHDALGSPSDRVLAVAAVPDEKRGERVVVLHLPAVGRQMEGVFEQLRQRGLPNLWIPDVRDCYPVESFPVLGSGKLDLKRVGELAKEKATARG